MKWLSGEFFLNNVSQIERIETHTQIYDFYIQVWGSAIYKNDIIAVMRICLNNSYSCDCDVFLRLFCRTQKRAEKWEMSEIKRENFSLSTHGKRNVIIWREHEWKWNHTRGGVRARIAREQGMERMKSFDKAKSEK